MRKFLTSPLKLYARIFFAPRTTTIPTPHKTYRHNPPKKYPYPGAGPPFYQLRPDVFDTWLQAAVCCFLLLLAWLNNGEP